MSRYTPTGADWAKPGKDGSFDVMNTCTHRADQCSIVQEAEQVTILYSPRTDQTHFSVQYEGWFTCSTMTPEQFEAMDMTEVLKRAKAKLDFLKLIAPPAQE